MARPRTRHVCQECGGSSAKWMGRCPTCGAWGTLVEETVAPAATAPARGDRPQPVAIGDLEATGGGEVRVRTGLGELDGVLGGGLVAGSLVLLGGDPGVGKSTLLLMALDHFTRKGLSVLYVTGEESVRQVQLRARRLGIGGPTLQLLAETDFDRIEQVTRETRPRVLVIDSVQTVRAGSVDGIPGSVSQIREVAHRAMVLAKQTGTATFLVGHVTKSGDLAGPKVLEHFVDTVLYFEGDGHSALRILRTVKNRFGPAGELGLFEMAEDGLREVPDASARFLSERVHDAPGTAVVTTLEGSRPLLAEVQALVGSPTLQTPARTCVGVSRPRVLMLAAVLEKAGLALQDRDLFVNAAGGLRLVEPAVDLGIIAAIASSLAETALPQDTLLLGEVGLVGEVRAVPYPRLRLEEARRQGFTRAIVPRSVAAEAPEGLEALGVRTVGDALALLD